MSRAIQIVKLIILVNGALSIVALLFCMTAFGLLTASFTAALQFPLALPSMVQEADPLGIWIGVSLLVLAVALYGGAYRGSKKGFDNLSLN